MGNCPLSFMRQKRIVIKSRNKQNGRPRKIDQEKYNESWERIFGGKTDVRQEKNDEKQ